MQQRIPYEQLALFIEVTPKPTPLLHSPDGPAPQPQLALPHRESHHAAAARR